MSKKPYDALSIPPAARRDGGTEVMRAAALEHSFAMSLRRSFDDPQVWGALLATAAMQLARIYATELGLDEAETREKIRATFEAELGASGDPGTITAA